MNFQQLVARFGKYTFVVALLVVALNFWKVVDLSNVPIALNVLYGYLLVNGIVATPFIYLERRLRRQPGWKCPACGNTMVTSQLVCTSCGGTFTRQAENKRE